MFDDYSFEFEIPESTFVSVNIIYDATFFGREYGFIVFHDNERVVYFDEIKTEQVVDVKQGLNKLQTKGYTFKSFTVDGKRGVIKMLEREFPNTPIQFCHFHQQAIIRRYITNNPKTDCGIDIKILMRDLKLLTEKEFAMRLKELEQKHSVFIAEKNENNDWKHKRICSAIRSLKTNLPYLFAYKNYPSLNVPNTTNKLEGLFAHLKEKVKIHRGLRLDRKKKMIRFILSKS
jgi:transposase-like protein